MAHSALEICTYFVMPVGQRVVLSSGQWLGVCTETCSMGPLAWRIQTPEWIIPLRNATRVLVTTEEHAVWKIRIQEILNRQGPENRIVRMKQS